MQKQLCNSLVCVPISIYPPKKCEHQQTKKVCRSGPVSHRKWGQTSVYEQNASTRCDCDVWAVIGSKCVGGAHDASEPRGTRRKISGHHCCTIDAGSIIAFFYSLGCLDWFFVLIFVVLIFISDFCT